MVAHLRAGQPPLLRQVYWACFSNPCCGVFQPFYLHGCKLPESYALGKSTYAADAPWWQANRIKLLCDLNYQALHPKVREVFDPIEVEVMNRNRTCEEKVLRLIGEGQTGAAVQVAQAMVDGNCARIKEQYEILNRTLPDTLKKAGNHYLYTDYLKSWTLKSGVPIPAD